MATEPAAGPLANEIVPPSVRREPRIVLLAVLLALSGSAALIYQLVWFQLLTLVIGASAPSLGVLLATFMGGMCLGALALPRVVSRHRDPLVVYAAIEAGIAVCGALVLLGLPALADGYAALSGGDARALLPRVLLASLALLPPAILIGATLPALARALPPGLPVPARLGALYGANLGGAAVGSVVAGFYLLRVHDVAVATAAAVALNASAAAASALAARRRSDSGPVGTPLERYSAPQRDAAWSVYAAAALSGFTALAAEVLWTRHLSLLLGGTVYTFALILAVFLVGLGLGSAAGAAAGRRSNARLALAVTQLALCAALWWTAWTIARSLPYWPLDVTLATAPGIALQLDLVRVGYAILPATALWGASFPLALAAVRGAHDGSRLVANVYVWNTLGAVGGALATSFVLITAFGSTATQRILIAAAAGAAVLLLIGSRAGRLQASIARGAALAGAVGIAALCMTAVPRLPPELVAFGRFLPTRAAGTQIVYVGEGRTASVAVSRQPDGALTYHNAGKAQASTYPQDMRLQRMLGHLTTLTASAPRSVLVIGLGAGITAGAVAIDPGVEQVVVAELEPLAARTARDYFGVQNYGVLENPKVQLAVDDGRHYLGVTSRRFDAITSDPLDPWVKGAAALYTREFWELARSRLNPGGVVTAFVQLYETTESAVKSELATFFTVFPNGALFANTIEGTGYDAVLFARAGDEPIDVDAAAARLRATAYGRVAESLREVGFASTADLFGTYAAGASDLTAWLADAELNTDRNLRLQYLAGEGLNLNVAAAIFANVRALTRAELPPELFAGSASELEAIRQRLRAGAETY